MEQIHNLCRLDAQQLYDKLVEAAEAARESGTDYEQKEAFDTIEAIIYTLKNCQFDEDRPVCPKCGQAYNGHPAISRDDNKTKICSACGLNEAMQAVSSIDL